MDMVLKICIADGSEVILDGFDKLSFYNELPRVEASKSCYSWQREHYLELLNNLSKYKFLGIERNDSNHRMEYRQHSFAFKNSEFEGNEPFYLTTSTITTIINMA